MKKIFCYNFATYFLRRLLTSDVVVWTVALSPLLWVPEVQMSKRPVEMLILSSLSYSTDPIFYSFSPESLALHWYMAWNGVTPI